MGGRPVGRRCGRAGLVVWALSGAMVAASCGGGEDSATGTASTGPPALAMFPQLEASSLWLGAGLLAAGLLAAGLLAYQVLGHRQHGPRPTVQQLQDRLYDARSTKVAFVSHCLLNQNVRYLGGATRPAMIESVVDDLRHRDIGIVQMPCPEQSAWGGVLKRRMLHLYGSPFARSRVGHRLVVPIARQWTAHRYRRLARSVARDIADYIDAGYQVTEIIGVGSSPSCGIATTINLEAAIDAMARCDPATIDSEGVNAAIVKANTTPGRGLFIDALLARLAARHITVPVREHDLLVELDLAAQTPVLGVASFDPSRRRAPCR